MKRAAAVPSEGGKAKKARAEGYQPTVMEFFLEHCDQNVEDFAAVAEAHRWLPTRGHERILTSEVLQVGTALDLVCQCMFEDGRKKWLYAGITPSDIIEAISLHRWQLHPAHAALWVAFQDSACPRAVDTLLWMHEIATLGESKLTRAGAVKCLRAAGRRQYELALQKAIKAVPVVPHVEIPKVAPLVITTPVPPYVPGSSTNDMGTHRIGYVHCTYNDLVKHFGPPTFGPDIRDGDKITCEWNFCIEGCEINIYDWKLFFTPYFEYDWNIGGRNKEVLDVMRKAMPGKRVSEDNY